MGLAEKAEKLTAKDVMEESVVRLSPDQSAADACRVFTEYKISGAPVVSERHGLVGVLSQTDVLREAFLEDLSETPISSYYVGEPLWSGKHLETVSEKLEAMSVSDVMSSHVYSVSPDDDLSSLANKMRSNHVHRLIVVEGKNQIVGIVTAFGLLRLLENL